MTEQRKGKMWVGCQSLFFSEMDGVWTMPQGRGSSHMAEIFKTVRENKRTQRTVVLGSNTEELVVNKMAQNRIRLSPP